MLLFTNLGTMAYVIFLLLISSLNTFTTATVDLQFLRGVSRNNNHSHWDYFFSCTTIGQTLQWEVNNYGLGGFDGADDIGRVLASTRSNFSYTATLLAIEKKTSSPYSYSSVLILSVIPRLLNISCLNGSTSRSTRNSFGNDNIENRKNSDNIHFIYLLSQPIISVTSISYLTSVFICVVNNFNMSWRTNASDNIYVFSTAGNNVGEHFEHLRDSDTVVAQQAILIGRGPHNLVSVFFATGNADTTVTCGYPENELQLTTRLFYSGTTETPSESPENTKTSEESVDITSQASFGNSLIK